FLIQLPAGVEELLQWQTALLMPILQFLDCRFIFYDMPFFKAYLVGLQPLLSLPAGSSSRVAYK
ncbi:MAG: hypothetical protein WBK18_11055, partial [Thermacetogeniaceae bacterium]